MTPADVTRLVQRYGETLTLRRPGAPNVDVAVKGVTRALHPDALVGEITQFERKVVISNAEIAAASWPGPPKRGDRVIFADGTQATVLMPGTRKLGDQIAGHWMIVKGG